MSNDKSKNTNIVNGNLCIHEQKRNYHLQKTETVYTKTNKPITKFRTTKTKNTNIVNENLCIHEQKCNHHLQKLKRYIQKQKNQSQNVERQKQKTQIWLMKIYVYRSKNVIIIYKKLKTAITNTVQSINK